MCIVTMADLSRLRNVPDKFFKTLQMQYQKVWKAYSSFLLKDPSMSTRLEAMLRISSYVIPGRFVASKELGELLYGASNLLALLHDNIFRRSLRLRKYPGADEENRLLLYLSVVESVEVFLEMAAERVWGEIGKWLVVAVIQLSKVALRMLLLYRDKPKLQRYPLVPLLNRQLVLQAARNKEAEGMSGEKESENGQDEVEHGEVEDGEVEDGEVEDDEVLVEEVEEQHVWKGKRSGRSVRSLAASPPSGFRSWKLPQSSNGETSSELNQKQFCAEMLYVLRPLFHLPCMFISGEKSWKPWLLACFADVASLGLHTKCNPCLTSVEKTEISRRMVLTMFYLLRSPFYDRFTKLKVMTVLNGLSRNVPFVSVVIQPLLEYLPSWQRTYFYNWCA